MKVGEQFVVTVALPADWVGGSTNTPSFLLNPKNSHIAELPFSDVSYSCLSSPDMILRSSGSHTLW